MLFEIQTVAFQGFTLEKERDLLVFKE